MTYTNKTTEDKLEEAAAFLMFGKDITYADFLTKIQSIGLRMRKGKGFTEIVSAIESTRRNGMGKTEYELSYLAAVLTRIVCNISKRKE